MRFVYVMGGISLVFALGCFYLVAGWLNHLADTAAGYDLTAIPAGLVNMPADSAIGGAVFLAGLVFLCIAVNLLSRGEPPA